MKTILQLAKENQVERFLGSVKIPGKAKRYSQKDCNCIVCHRSMTAPEFENPPHYCYICDDMLEAVMR